jgi:glyoxylase-like metal-dependent hydrolase (beta-lactamase superfamily II)
VITDTDYILIETGSGHENLGRPIIKDLLAKEGITPEQITKVFLTHFHKDHIDGLGIIKKGIPINFPMPKFLDNRENMNMRFCKHKVPLIISQN